MFWVAITLLFVVLAAYWLVSTNEGRFILLMLAAMALLPRVVVWAIA